LVKGPFADFYHTQHTLGLCYKWHETNRESVMEDVLTRVSRLERPQILVQTARLGLTEYCRDRHLRRLLKTDTPPQASDAVIRLLDMETALDSQRQQDRAAYSIARHVGVLIALMSEAATLRAIRKSRRRLAPMG